MVKLSIILPVYGAEKYISTCLDSIFSQEVPESEYEVICVDDCSADRSVEIIRNYQQLHENLFLIRHKINKKAGGARNTGLHLAQGDFVWFVDPDDYLAVNSLQIVLSIMTNQRLDVLCINQILDKDGQQSMELVFPESSIVYEGVTFLEQRFGRLLVYNLGYPCRAIYRKKMLYGNCIFFPEKMLYGEDTTFMAEAIMVSKRVMCIPDALYYYRQNINSATTQLFEQWKGDLIYQSIITAGCMVIKLYEQALNCSKELAADIRDGVPWFVNRLFMRLVRTDRKNRSVFYQQLSEAKNISSHVRCDVDALHKVYDYMDAKNRFVVRFPMLGKVVLNVLSLFYCWKHGNSKI